jgi:pimeloyl-ACP methyl ester carboxylesterase
MKKNDLLIRISVHFLLIMGIITSCSKDNEKPTDNIYLVSTEKAVSYTSTYANNLISYISFTNPEVASLLTYVTSDVDVYRVVYQTSLYSKPIYASGLICVPATPGEYPVLCFQNGTNTLHANAPSVNPSDFLYQILECVASMEYVVVVPDYPGFGKSSQEIHPYLIAEPTVRSIVDMLYAVKEFGNSGIPGLIIKNEFYLFGYSQGGWATLALHKAIEQNYLNDIKLAGSVCGAGPYDLYFLLENIVGEGNYPMPVYLGYILNAYSAYGQFTNPVTDIFNEPYASRLSSLYDGTKSSQQINDQLTSTITQLVKTDFILDFATGSKYSSVRDAFKNNSITPWETKIPLLLVHGGKDKDVNPETTLKMYDALINAGTGTDICKKKIFPDADHSTGLVPCAVEAIHFLKELPKQ